MGSNKIKLKHEHKEVLNDLKNVVISYTPVSGLIDTAKFVNKWVFRKKLIRRTGRKVGSRYRMYVLERTAKKYGSP